MNDLTPETLRADATWHRQEAARYAEQIAWYRSRDFHDKIAASEEIIATNQRTADILEGLAALTEMQKLNALAAHRGDKWSVGPHGELFFSRINGEYDSPAAALIALAQQARERRGTDGN